MNESSSLKILIVDDEAPARERLLDMLGDIAAQLETQVVGQASNGLEALELLAQTHADAALVDIRMPGMDGIELAQHLCAREIAPRIIFVTAYDEYAVQAFELNAVDYLLKPVRAQRLLQALQKIQPSSPQNQAPTREVLKQIAGPRKHFTVTERGKIFLIPTEEVLYFKAELKYLTLRTQAREYVLEESLINLEQEFADTFVRIHRNSIVARSAIAGFERASGGEQGEGQWLLKIKGIDDKLAISRRQWGEIKKLF